MPSLPWQQPKPDENLPLYDNTLGGALRALYPLTMGQDHRFDAIPLKAWALVSFKDAEIILENPVLYAEIREAAVAPVLQMVRTEIEPRLAGWEGTPQFVSMVNNALEKHWPEIDRAVNLAFAKGATALKQWSGYKRTHAIGVLKCSAMIVGAGMSFALAVPSLGASLAFAIFSTVKAVGETAKEIARLSVSAERLYGSIEADILIYAQSAMRAHWQRAPRTVVGGITRTLGVHQAIDAVTTFKPVSALRHVNIADVRQKVTDYHGKVAHLFALANKVANKLIKLLDSIEQHERAGTPLTFSQEDQKVLALLDGTKTNVSDPIATYTQNGEIKAVGGAGDRSILGLVERYRAGLKRLPDIETKLSSVESKDPSAKAYAMAEIVITLCGDLAMFFTGTFNPQSVDAGMKGEVLREAMDLLQDGPAGSGFVANPLGIANLTLSSGLESAGMLTAGQELSELAHQRESLMASDPAFIDRLNAEQGYLRGSEHAPRLPAVDLGAPFSL